MTIKRMGPSLGAFVLASLMVIGAQGLHERTVVAQGAAQPATARPASGSQADAPMVGQGTLIAGAWGASPLPVDARGWGYLSKAYVSDGYKRPFWNKAKELLFSGKQVTSFTSARSIRSCTARCASTTASSGSKCSTARCRGTTWRR